MKKLTLDRRRNDRRTMLVVVVWEMSKETIEIRNNGIPNPKRIIGGPGCSMI